MLSEYLYDYVIPLTCRKIACPKVASSSFLLVGCPIVCLSEYLILFGPILRITITIINSLRFNVLFGGFGEILYKLCYQVIIFLKTKALSPTLTHDILNWVMFLTGNEKKS